MSKILIPSGSISVDEEFDSIEQIESKSQSFYKEIDQYKTRLKMLAIANPKDIVGDDEDPISSVEARVEDYVNAIVENAEDGRRLQLFADLLDDWRFDNNPIDTRKKEGFEEVFVHSRDEFLTTKECEDNPFDFKDFPTWQDYAAACVKDLELNSRYADPMYVIFFKGKLVTGRDKIFTYKTLEEAESAFIHYVMPGSLNIMPDKYRAKNPQLLSYMYHYAERHPNLNIDPTIFKLIPHKPNMGYIDEFLKAVRKILISYFKGIGELEIKQIQ